MSLVSLRRPSAVTLQTFLGAQRPQPFAYDCVGATLDGTRPPGYAVNHQRIPLGAGARVFASAKTALESWQEFRLGWVEPFPGDTPIRAGEVVAVTARVGGLWLLNACRIVYAIDEPARFGFAYGTLPGHLEKGEERFLIEWNREDDSVCYEILAYSRPQHWIAKLGYPFARRQQARFGCDSLASMQRAVLEHG